MSGGGQPEIHNVVSQLHPNIFEQLDALGKVKNVVEQEVKR